MSSYVYCVTRASHPLPLEGAVGVGGHAPAPGSCASRISSRWLATRRRTCARSGAIW